MSDKSVDVKVTISAKNATGPGIKAAEEALSKVARPREAMFAPLAGSATRKVVPSAQDAAWIAAALAKMGPPKPLPTFGQPIVGAGTSAGGGGVGVVVGGAAGLTGGPGGGGGSGLLASVKELTNGLKEMRLSLALGAAAVSHFVAEGAPLTWRTFTGSITLLGDQVAQIMIPAFLTASQHLQNAATWVENLDEGTKKLIGDWAGLGATVLVGGAILGTVGPIFVTLAMGVWHVGTALFATGKAILYYNSLCTAAAAKSAILTGWNWLASLSFVGLGTAIRGAAAASLAFAVTPLGLALIGVAATVGVLTNGFGLLGSSIASASGNASDLQERISRLQEPGGRVTRADFQSLTSNARTMIEGTTPANRESTRDWMLQWRQQELQTIMRAGPSALESRIESALEAPTSSFGLPVGGAIAAGQRRDRIRPILQQAGLAPDEVERRLGQMSLWSAFSTMSQTDRRAQSVIGSQSDRAAVVAAEIETIRRTFEQGVPGLFAGLKSAAPMQAQMFQSGSDAWYQVLQETLSRGPIEQQHLYNIMLATQMQVEKLTGIEGALGARGRAAGGAALAVGGAGGP